VRSADELAGPVEEAKPLLRLKMEFEFELRQASLAKEEAM